MNEKQEKAIKKEFIRLFNILEDNDAERYQQKDAYRYLITIYNDHFGTFKKEEWTCGKCAAKFRKDCIKLIKEWRIEEK